MERSTGDKPMIPYSIMEGIHEWSAILRLIGHPQRLAVLYLLCKQPMSVKGLQEKLSISQSVLSQHLGLLRRAKLVERRKDGTLAIYSIGEDRLRDLIKTICCLPEEHAKKTVIDDRIKAPRRV